MPSSSSSIPSQSQRLPAPALFIAPPSRNASTLDITKSPAQTSGPSSLSKSLSSNTTARTTPSSAIPGPNAPFPHQNSQSSNLRPPSPQKSRRQQIQQQHQISFLDTRDREHAQSHPREQSQTALRADQLPDLPFPPAPNDPSTPVGEDSQAQHQNLHPQSQAGGGATRPRRGTAILDAHWAALQSTLSDIELNASGSSHVFGSSHAAALEELRQAQVELARAWGPKGGADDALADETGAGIRDSGVHERGGSVDGTAGSEGAGLARTETGKSIGRRSAEVRHSHSQSLDKNRGLSQKKSGGLGGDAGGDDGDDDTNADLEAAEQRRKESDAYFQKVKGGVDEVVTKLESVSRAMRHVEMESREIWGDGGNSDASTELESVSMRS